MGRRLQVTIDCHDPGPLVAFWAEALGYVAEPPPDGFASSRSYWLNLGVPSDELEGVEGAESVVDPDGVGPRLWFQVVPESKKTKNRVHLDIDVTPGRSVPIDQRRAAVRTEAERLITLGATRVRVLDESAGHYGELLADPEGNEFCIR